MTRFLIINTDCVDVYWTDDPDLALMFQHHPDHIVVDTDEMQLLHYSKREPVEAATRALLREDEFPYQWEIKEKNWVGDMRVTWETYEKYLSAKNGCFVESGWEWVKVERQG